MGAGESKGGIFSLQACEDVEKIKIIQIKKQPQPAATRALKFFFHARMPASHRPSFPLLTLQKTHARTRERATIALALRPSSPGSAGRFRRGFSLSISLELELDVQVEPQREEEHAEAEEEGGDDAHAHLLSNGAGRARVRHLWVKGGGDSWLGVGWCGGWWMMGSAW